jgi:5-methylcytosine-specific restriction endonuclease McrA
MPYRIEHKEISVIECKLCSKCKMWKLLKEFGKSKRRWDGLSNYCRSCISDNRRRRALKRNIFQKYSHEDESFTRKLFNSQCFNCGSKKNLCIDHHKPLSKGNALTRKNAVLLCNSCNCSKQDKLPEEFYCKEKIEQVNKILGI